MKKVFALLLAALLVLSAVGFVGCANGKDNKDGKDATAAPNADGSDEGGAKTEALGTFVSVKHKFNADTEWVEDTGWELELNADGKGVSRRDNLELAVTWELNGEDITVTESSINEYTGTLKDGELSLFNGDPANDLTCEYIFNRK